MQTMTGYFGTTTEVSKRQLKPKCRTVLPYGQLQEDQVCLSQFCGTCCTYHSSNEEWGEVDKSVKTRHGPWWRCRLKLPLLCPVHLLPLLRVSSKQVSWWCDSMQSLHSANNAAVNWLGGTAMNAFTTTRLLHTFNGPLFGTTRVSRYQKGKTEARDSEWQWHQLGLMQVCTSLQRDNHASTPHSNN